MLAAISVLAVRAGLA
jgi:hypothetical protein